MQAHQPIDRVLIYGRFVIDRNSTPSLWQAGAARATIRAMTDINGIIKQLEQERNRLTLQSRRSVESVHTTVQSIQRGLCP